MSTSILTSWALLVWQELNARELDADTLFREAGLDPAKLATLVARYPVKNMQRLWQSAQDNGDEHIGISIGNRWNPTTFHALGFAWLASGSLSEALYRFSRYGMFLNDGLDYELRAEQLRYRFSISFKPDKQNNQVASIVPASSDAGITALLKMIRMIMGDQFEPIQIVCPHPPNSASLLLEQLARCPVQYGGNTIEFVFDRRDIERKLLTGNAELSFVNEQILTKHLADLDNEQLTPKVELEIVQQLPTGNIKEKNISKGINLSSRTMQRRLAQEGTSFAELLQKTRKTLADRYVSDNKLAISEIAFLLGFSEQANFTRAFKRWHGLSPSQYRQKVASTIR
ncbi:AraC family transcriptional regulator [Marinobacter sediminum]|uniref:AraC family transcriptional regulator n=1 Tax=Marinobacter sediminum TaxID=256323 RepID=UPI002030CE38|nr:AraC family transcriptional regulator [Marinobacter sediminum]